jgi:hypothetical protein
MKLLIALVFAAGVLAQVADEPYPGQSEHREPPAGWMCHRPPVDLKGDQSHWCSCERTCDQDTQVVHEDKNCAVFCHADHCQCDIANASRCMPQGQR